jgi:hypothetical protein
VQYDTSIGVEAKERVFLDRAGGLARRLPMRQMLTSWTSLYGAMRRHFPAEHYHQGAELTDFGQSAERVEARFTDGREVTGGLLVAQKSTTESPARRWPTVSGRCCAGAPGQRQSGRPRDVSPACRASGYKRAGCPALYPLWWMD